MPTRDHASSAPAATPLIIAGAVSVLGGIAIIWLFAPMFFAALGPGELALIAGLIALPLPTAWVLWKDARNRRYVAIHTHQHAHATNAAHSTDATTGPHALDAPDAIDAHSPPDAIHEPASRTPTTAPRPITTPRPARRVLHEPAWTGKQ
jgi:ABC-type nickel/cobalt efflux system permease component RcnA